MQIDLDYTIIDGSGVPIYLFPTFPLDRTYLEQSLENIHLQNPIVAFDFRNHGKSPDGPLNELKFKIMAEDIRRLQQKLDHEKIIVFGHGMGGFIALHFLSKYHSDVVGLILYSTAGNKLYREDLAWNIRNLYTWQIKDMLDEYYQKIDVESLDVKFTQSYATYFKEPNLEQALELVQNAHRMAYEAYVVLQDEVEHYTIRSKIRKYTQPFLLLFGEFDVWPKGHTLYLENDLPQAKVVQIGDVGHFGMVEKQKTFWEFIDTWIRDTVQ